MNYFRFSKNDEFKFVITELDFVNFCNQYREEILEHIGTNGTLPDTLDDAQFMTIPHLDELLENYFTLKFLIREYGMETPEEVEEIADFIAQLLNLAKKDF